MKKEIPKEISEHYRKLAQKGVEARHAKLLEKIRTQKKDEWKGSYPQLILASERAICNTK